MGQSEGGKSIEGNRGKMSDCKHTITLGSGAIIEVAAYECPTCNQAEIKRLKAANQELRSDNRRMAIQNEAMNIVLYRIISWCNAYPLDIFPEPDFKKARELLESGGITLDSVSASNMRHVINGFRELAQAAIDAVQDGEK